MTLVELVAGADALLLDFDGPICAVFAGYTAATIAGELRALVAAHGVTADLAHATGPLHILRLVADLGDPSLTRTVADALRDAETVAVASARPTPGADGVLRAAHMVGRPVAIVTNNAEEAVHAYLDRHGLAGLVARVVARHDTMDPRLLKPDVHLVHQALRRLDVEPDRAVFVGDSTTDIEAGHAEGVPTIGYANKPGKRERLTDAGADAVIDTMTELSEALQRAAQTRMMERRWRF
jgi:HAD superfamily hydrolase (TIGR01509 family)